MTEQARIVVGVDGGDHGWQALDWAAEEADRAVMRLLVCRVYRRDAANGLTASPSTARLALADPVLAGAVRQIREKVGGRRVAVTVGHGEPAHRLVQVAAGSRLLVVGDRDRNAAARALLGSVSQAAIARATGPVLVVRGGPAG